MQRARPHVVVACQTAASCRSSTRDVETPSVRRAARPKSQRVRRLSCCKLHQPCLTYQASGCAVRLAARRPARRTSRTKPTLRTLFRQFRPHGARRTPPFCAPLCARACFVTTNPHSKRGARPCTDGVAGGAFPFFQGDRHLQPRVGARRLRRAAGKRALRRAQRAARRRAGARSRAQHACVRGARRARARRVRACAQTVRARRPCGVLRVRKACVCRPAAAVHARRHAGK